MDVLILVGRILFAMIFIGGGMGHLMDREGSVGYATARNVPNPGTLVPLSGVLIMATGVGIALGIFLDLAALGAAVYALLAAFLVHHFWTDTDDMTKQTEMSGFMKNLSIAGGGLIIFALAGGGTDMGWTLTDALFSL